MIAQDHSDRTTIAAADVGLTVMRRLGEGPPGPVLTGGCEGGIDLRPVIVSG